MSRGHHEHDWDYYDTHGENGPVVLTKAEPEKRVNKYREAIVDTLMGLGFCLTVLAIVGSVLWGCGAFDSSHHAAKTTTSQVVKPPPSIPETMFVPITDWTSSDDNHNGTNYFVREVEINGQCFLDMWNGNAELFTGMTCPAVPVK